MKNYGIITSILTHVIQHTGITPIVTNEDLREDLKNLRFEAICSRFGRFFLHDLDLTNGRLPEVKDKDTQVTLGRIGITTAKKPKKKSPALELLPTQDSLTWFQLKHLVNQGSDRAKIKDFEFKDSWRESRNARALFCRFTYEYWLQLGLQAFLKLPGEPINVEEAMKLWTIKSIKERMIGEHSYHLTPSADGLHNNIPTRSKHQLFSLKRAAFFPSPNETLVQKSGWKLFYKHGYVLEYHQAIEHSTDEGKLLNDSLDLIFKNLQVLPLNPGRPCDLKKLWLWEGDELKLLLNSNYVQLADRKIRFNGGTGRERRKGGTHKMREKRELEKLLRYKGPIPTLKRNKDVKRSHAVAVQDLMQGRKKGKPKNYRKPPTNRKRAPAGPEKEQSRSRQSRPEPGLVDQRMVTRQGGRLTAILGKGLAKGREEAREQELPPTAHLKQGYEPGEEEEESSSDDRDDNDDEEEEFSLNDGDDEDEEE